MLTICKDLFSQWNLCVKYCHWKGNEPSHLSRGLDGVGDLDILLDKNDEKKGTDILKSLQFIQCKSQYGSRYPDVEDWIGFDKETGKLVHVHLHYVLKTGHNGIKEYNLPWVSEALTTRSLNEEFGVYVMDPNLEMVTLYTRIALKATSKQVKKAKKGLYDLKKDFKKDLTSELEYLRKESNKEAIEEILKKYYSDDYKILYDIIKLPNLDSAHFLSLYRVVTRSIGKNANYYGTYFLQRQYFTIVDRTISWLKRQECSKKGTLILRKVPIEGNGISIAFLGQDGSGKSTVTKEIVKWLVWKLESKIFYFGSGDEYNPWQKKVINILSRHKNPIFSFACYIVAFSMNVAWAKNVRRTIKKAGKYKKKGGIVIFDRYPQDCFYGINDGPKIREKYINRISTRMTKILLEPFAKREEAIISKVVKCPPEIVFKLHLSPEESMRRKPFENYLSVKKKHEIIKGLSYCGSVIYDIDATQDYKTEILMIKTKIWESFQRL